jgi:hypothetical protein
MNVRLEYTVTLTAGVFWEESMRMNNYTFVIHMLVNCNDAESHDVAFERLKHFVFLELDSTIFINQEHTEQCQRFVDAGLKITTLPADPVDQVIGMMLHSKLNAIMEDRIVVTAVRSSSIMGDSMVYLHTADEGLGPFEKAGWWQDPGPVHYDTNLVDSDKIVALNQTGQWRELELAWPANEVKNQDNTVVFADFKRDETK